jgi:stearoyl-CoA desaturase (delta-9 desaturase)
MSKFWERFFFVSTWLWQGSSFLLPKPYAIIHREHHKKSDTEEDPHSPSNFKNIFAMMFATKDIFKEIKMGRHKLYMLYKGEWFPKWKDFEEFTDTYFSMGLMVAVQIGIYYLLADYWWQWLFFPFTMLNGPIQGAIVNWWGHTKSWLSYRNFNEPDKSRNVFLVSELMHAETNQNNHHHDAQNPNLGGVRWFEIDTAYYIILLFNKLGIIRLPEKYS